MKMDLALNNLQRLICHKTQELHSNRAAVVGAAELQSDRAAVIGAAASGTLLTFGEMFAI